MNNAINNLHPFCQHVFTQYPIRKNKVQKQNFRGEVAAELRQAGWDVQVQSRKSLPSSHNVVIGDVSTAKVICTAHYDTPAALPFPNFIAPQNFLFYLLYQLGLVLVLLAVGGILGGGISWLLALVLPMDAMLNVLASTYISLMLLLVLFFLMMAGPANRNNANDNTSGVLTVLETALTMPPHLRGNVAFVLFDNEELGLLGSAAFKKQYGRQIAPTPLINFDCVGDGDHILFVQPARCRKNPALQAALAESFVSAEGKQIILEHKPLTFYPSDQAHFPMGIGVGTFHKKPVLGLYLGRIHTKRDTVLQQENIVLLRQGIINFAGRLV